MFMKKPRHRVFDYQPRFYKPEEDPQEKRKKKFGFGRSRKFTQKKRSSYGLLLFILIVALFYLKYKGYI